MKAMKKIIVALLIALTGVGVANAELRFGIKAGVNLNSLHLNKDLKENFNSDNGTGWTAGVMGEYMAPVIGLGVDVSLMYTRMNADVDIINSQTGTVETLKNSNFLQIPINIKYRFSLPVVGRFVAPYIFTGPDLAFKLGKSTLEDLKTRTCQVAWNVGIGLQLFKHVQISGSYGFGLNNVVEKVASSLVNIQDDVKMKNNYWTITAAYLF